jgi:6-phosphogluconolactonase (cycloisomerase 2 family)
MEVLIYVGSSDTDGAITLLSTDDRGVPHVAAEPTPVRAPSWLTPHPRLPVLYATNELPGEPGGVSAYAVGGPGVLRPLGAQPSGGVEPCHLALSPDGRYLFVANYGNGRIGVLPVGADGSLGEPTEVVQHEPTRDEPAHVHQITLIGDAVTAVDLGADRLFGYRLSDDGRLHPTWTADALPKAGPRHLVVHPSGRRYVTDELASAVSTYVPDPDTGGLRRVATVPATCTGAGPGENAVSELALSADGRYLYVANRGPSSISVFAVTDEALEPVGEVPTGGEFPRHFTLAGDRIYVANQHSHDITVLRLDPHTGLPVLTGDRAEVHSPTCLLVWG